LRTFAPLREISRFLSLVGEAIRDLHPSLLGAGPGLHRDRLREIRRLLVADFLALFALLA
jgi:hypothetical protein